MITDTTGSYSGRDRRDRVRQAVLDAGFDAMVATLPSNVLLLSGYWPVVATAVAVATAGGRCAILAPSDEKDLASTGWADLVHTYAPGSLKSLALPVETVQAPLGDLLQELGVQGGRLGYEDGTLFEESTYSAMYLFNGNLSHVLQFAAPQASITGASAMIAHLRSSLTHHEVDRVRLACEIAGESFAFSRPSIRAGQRESQVAATYSGEMEVRGLASPQVQRGGAFAWCMSGPNSAEAGAAYARTRNRTLQAGDFVLIHCNSYVDGYWTDITRTYCLGTPDARQRSICEAIFAARSAALAVIKPGVRASEVDHAARAVLEERGFGSYFTHGLGHNVGFSAISGDFPPRLSPTSPDVLTVGMTFNVEPAIYLEGYGGVRHCDVVTVTAGGSEVLTPFDADVESVVLPV